jgi:HAE1 family hydrophobic/amphiphilic exporter-1
MKTLPWIVRTCRLAAGALAFGTVIAPGTARAGQAQAPPAQPSSAQAQAAGGPTLPLSMEQAVEMALESNLGLKADRMELEVADLAIASARAAFLPRAQSSFSRNTQEQFPQRTPEGTLVPASQTSLNGGATWSQTLPWYGANYQFSWGANRRSSVGTSSTFNPIYGSSFGFRYSQPLWRGLFLDSNRLNLESNQRRRAIADITLEQNVVTLDASVRNAYLSLIGAIQGQRVAQQNLETEQNALANARARVGVGVAPQSEIVSYEAQVATRRVQVIAAEANIEAAEDVLRRLVLDPNRPDYWQLRLVPSDEIQLTPREINLDQAVENALKNRLDLIAARRDIELTDLNMRLSRDATRPDLFFDLTYSASGSGGRASDELLTRNFRAVLGDAFGGAYPSWTTGFTFSYPIGRSAAEASHAQAQVRRQQQEIGLRELERDVVQQVRNAVRQVENRFRQLEAAQTALDLSIKQLEADQRRFEVGLSTTLELQTRQSLLAAARNSLLNATIDYNRALIEFDRVQKTR